MKMAPMQRKKPTPKTSRLRGMSRVGMLGAMAGIAGGSCGREKRRMETLSMMADGGCLPRHGHLEC